MEGPTSVRAGEEVEVQCTSGDSFPPTLLSWKVREWCSFTLVQVRRGGEEEKVGSEETVVEEVEGREGRSTASLLTFTAGKPGTLQVTKHHTPPPPSSFLLLPPSSFLFGLLSSEVNPDARLKYPQVECYGSHESLGGDRRAYSHTLHVLGESLTVSPLEIVHPGC